MTLAEVIKHVFSDKDMTEEVNSYTVTHTNSDNYTIEAKGITIQVVKKWLYTNTKDNPCWAIASKKKSLMGRLEIN